MQAIEEAWQQHAARNMIAAADDEWLKHEPSTQGWNPYRALPVGRPARTMDDAEGLDDAVVLYREWCEVYFHALLRREPGRADEAEREMSQLENFGNLEAAVVAQMENAKREAKQKYFDNTVGHRAAGYLRDAYKFDLAHEQAVTVAPHGTTRRGLGDTQSSSLAKGASRPPTGRTDGRSTTGGRRLKDKRHAAEDAAKRTAARKRWANLAVLAKMMALAPDTVVPAKVAGKSFCQYTLPFAANNVTRVPYNYDVIDKRVADIIESGDIDHAAMTCTEAAALLTKPYAMLTWRNSAEQRCHYSLRSIFKYITTVCAQAPAGTAIAEEDPDPAEVWKKKEGTSLDFAVLVHAMVADVEDLRSEVIRGYRRTGINVRGHPHDAKREAWNKMQWDNKKYFVNAHGGVESEFFWLTSPTTFINLHLPERARDQLALRPIQRAGWEVAPDPSYHFHTHGLALQSHVKYRHIVSKSPPLVVALYAVDLQVEIVPKLYEGAEDAKKLLQAGFVWQQRIISTSTAAFSCVLPDTGLYTLEFYVRRRLMDDSTVLDTANMTPSELLEADHHLALTYQVVSNTKVGDDPIMPLQRVPPSFAVMSLPSMGKLVAGQSKQFVIVPARSDIEGFVIVERRRQAVDKKAAAEAKKEAADGEGGEAKAEGVAAYTVMEYDPVQYAFVATIPALQRGTIDIYMRQGGEFIAAFTGFHVVAQLSSKEDFGVDLIEPIRPAEAVLVTRNIGNTRPAPKVHTAATFTADHVGGYFQRT